MDNIYVYAVPLPVGIEEVVTPCEDGYTIYIADWLDREHRIRAYLHALRHISREDFGKEDVQTVELHAH